MPKPPTQNPALTLATLLRQNLIETIEGDPHTTISGVQHDSRRIGPGDMFAAISGNTYEGARFIGEAEARGAVAILSGKLLKTSLAQAIVSNPRLAVGHIAETVYGHPTRTLSAVGITGTNGKTTVSHLLEAAIGASGGVPALMGTICHRGPDFVVEASHTTPEGDDIARFARSMHERGVTHLVMEVSSHALALHRVDAVNFKIVAFVNLSQDHLDFHADMEAYFAAKERLFKHLMFETAVINIDDPYGRRLLETAKGRLLRCTTDPSVSEAEVKVIDIEADITGVRLRAQTPAGEIALTSALLGKHNAQNIMIALGCAYALGLNLDQAVEGIESLGGVPGRMERIQVSPIENKAPQVFVDYAHTPEALRFALSTLSSFEPARVIVVFGCGGDRDKDKRPRMGNIAASLADLLVLTNDNPRTERAASILTDIEKGVRSVRQDRVSAAQLHDAEHGYARIEDRKDAIVTAISIARSDDVVLIAGKGHEGYQIVGTETRPFSDGEVAREALAEWRVR
ncbi:MAG: UDP-N-acetylmuramoyl-L-alanyl-D-glutamate--2,6-diaminopimelate ligase [Myxococcales bacterium]|nr:UDP-N-acetylmuramoyl-L-alanyl-D-glutamate--2,6-diaminopimelate ligase [Myxococcales bacterium]